MSTHEVEVTISSAKDIKNVNWRHGPNKPYAVVWVDPRSKCSTRVDEEGDMCPVWNETFVLHLPPDRRIDDDDNELCIDVVHAGREEDTKPLIGSARLRLREVLEDSGVGVPAVKSLKLKRPSGRPHGKLDVTVTVREHRYPTPSSYYAPPYGVAREPYGVPHGPPHPYGAPYAPLHPYGSGPHAPPPYAVPSSGYPPYGVQGAPPTGYPAYGQPEYGYGAPAEEKKKGSKFGGIGTGLAVGAVAGVLGGVALAEGVDKLEDHIADEAADKVEEDLADGDDFDGGDDF